jgi:hypothetical protein
MTVISLSEARELRPSQVIAEALVDRQAPKQIEARARELGYSNCLTTAVVHACCGHNEQPKSPLHLQTVPADHHASN